MKKLLTTIILVAITLCLISGCTKNKIIIYSNDNSKTAELNLPEKYSFKNLNSCILIYATKKQSEDDWDMMLTFEKSNFEEYKALINKNQSLSKTEDYKNNISYYLLENQELNQGSQLALKRLNDEYVITLRAQLEINSKDIIKVLNSVELIN